ncbi:MAG: hypothetical protein ABSB69_04535, partial [Solirubrobacteraceae bacterium]
GTVLGATCWAGAMTVAEALSTTSHAKEIVPGDVPGGPSTSQTIMMGSLRRLLSLVPADAPPDAYRFAVMTENVLAKDTTSGREWAFRQLRRFYSLDPHSLLFRALRDVWEHDAAGQPLLALLCAIARDPVLRASSAVILAAEPGAVVGPSDLEPAIEAAFPGAYNENTRRTTAQKIASSWAQSGHLHAETPTRKVRVRVHPTPAVVAYALLLGDLQGARGHGLFTTLWARILDQPKSHLFDLAATASQNGILEFRNAGGVVEVTFHHLLRPFADEQGTLQ